MADCPEGDQTSVEAPALQRSHVGRACDLAGVAVCILRLTTREGPARGPAPARPRRARIRRGVRRFLAYPIRGGAQEGAPGAVGLGDSIHLPALGRLASSTQSGSMPD